MEGQGWVRKVGLADQYRTDSLLKPPPCLAPRVK
jgi:hypothetical protein